MELSCIIELVDAKVLCGDIENKVVEKGFSSDLMSDVLTIDVDKLMLITGLANVQTIRTAEIADIEIILLVRNKQMNSEMLRLATENKMTVLQSPYSLFKVSGILYNAGLKPVY